MAAKKIAHNGDGVLGGVILLALGVLFLLDNTVGLDIKWGRYWPVILIVAGIYMILKKLKD